MTVSTGDFITDDNDGVVCIPASRVEEAVTRALAMEPSEKQMIPKIYEVKSLKKVVEIVRRI